MSHTNEELAFRLLSQVRSEFDHLRWQSKRLSAFLTHRATNAEAEGVLGHPKPHGQFVAMQGAGHREPELRLNEHGSAIFIDEPIIDVNGNPICASDGRFVDFVMPAFRSIDFTGDSSNYDLLATIADRAGRAISNFEFSVGERFSGWRFSSWSDMWWSTVFELAWSGLNPLLSAEKRLWIPSNNPSTYIPYDRPKLINLASQGFGGHLKIPDNWLKRLPEAWVSTIDDIIVASIDTADYLLSEITAPNDHDDSITESKATSSIPMKTELPMRIQRRFAVALSFPGTHRKLIQRVANNLKNALSEQRVLYDMFHQVEFASPNLDLKLQSLYGEESDLIVVFLCQNYQQSDWCGLEWRSVRELIKKRNRPEDVLLLRMDDGEVDGVFSIDGYINIAGKDARFITDAIIRRWSASR